MGEKMVQHIQSHFREASSLKKSAVVRLQVDQYPGGAQRIAGLLPNAAQKELDPVLPFSVLADSQQRAVVLVAVLFEESAEVQERLRQDLPVTQEQADQQPADASIPIDKRMDRLELVVNQGQADQLRRFVGGVDVPLPLPQSLGHGIDGWRH